MLCMCYDNLFFADTIISLDFAAAFFLNIIALCRFSQLHSIVLKVLVTSVIVVDDVC